MVIVAASSLTSPHTTWWPAYCNPSPYMDGYLKCRGDLWLMCFKTNKLKWVTSEPGRMHILQEGHILSHIIQMHVSSVLGTLSLSKTLDFPDTDCKQTLLTYIVAIERAHSDCAHYRNSRFLGSRSPIASSGAGLRGNVLLVCFSDTDDCVTTHINQTLSLQGEINRKIKILDQ